MVLHVRAGRSPAQQLAELQGQQNRLILRLRAGGEWAGGAEEKRSVLQQLWDLAAQIRVLDRQILEGQAG